MKRLEKEDLKQKQEETLAGHTVISDKVVERYLNQLHEHPINKVLYGEEDVDQTLVKSIQEKGQLEPIVITEDNVIISGHRRYLALKEINEKKLPLRVLDVENKSRIDYVDNVFMELKARCVIAQFNQHSEDKEQKETDEILAIIDYNKRRHKRLSQYYNEIKELHRIYDGEAERKMRRNLKQYADVTDLSRRYKNENPNISKKDHINKLIENGTISAEEIIKGKKYQNAKQKLFRTVDRIADEIGLGRTNVQKLTKIGDLAKEVEDEKAIKTMKYLDSLTFRINNAYNVVRLRKIQLKYKDNIDLYNELEQRINDVIEPPKEDESNNDIKKKKVITDKTVKYYTELVGEENKGKPQFNVILIEPDKDFETLNINKLNANESSALFIIANKGNLSACINRMGKLGYNYINFYTLADQLLLLGTKFYDEPKVKIDDIKDRNEVYSKIKELYPKEKHFHEVNNNTSKNKSDGWEIPIESVMSDKPVEADIKSSTKNTTKAATKNTTKAATKNTTKAATKNTTKAAEKANSKKKASNTSVTSDSTKNNTNGPVVSDEN